MGRLKKGLAIVSAALAGLAGLNTWLSWRVGAPESALGGKDRYFHWRRGHEVYNVFYKVAEGEGTPVVLVHGVDAAASSYEMKEVFAGLQGKRNLYALDLLGFGLSDRPALGYVAADYVDLVDAFLGEVVRQPAVVVARSLSAAYAVSVAARSPERVAALLLICPTGLQHLADPPGTGQRAAGALLGLPILGSALFNLLVSRASLRYFLRERTYANPDLVTDDVLDAYYRTSHQPGARHAPAAFVGGTLNHGIRETYPRLTQPVRIAWGRAAQFTPVSDSNQFIQTRRQSRLKVFDGCGLLPHVERPEEFLAYAEQMLPA
jgi:pimeloyl-ACP methyl ester carboxylesterase